VLAAVKLVPLGQSVGQRLLRRLCAAMPAILVRAQQLGDDAIGVSTVSQALASALQASQVHAVVSLLGCCCLAVRVPLESRVLRRSQNFLYQPILIPRGRISTDNGVSRWTLQ